MSNASQHTVRSSQADASDEMSVSHALQRYSVKGEDATRSCTIELSGGRTVQFYGVFDGHGGHLASHYCAEHMPQLVATAYAKAKGSSHVERLEAALHSAFVEADRVFATMHARGDGTTATCIIIDAARITVANVGDSEAHLYTPPSGAVQLTADHRVERRDAKEEQRIFKAGAQIGRVRGASGKPTGPERLYPGGLMVTRSIGDHDSTKACIPDPYIKTVPVPKEGGTILVGSDGVWDFIRPDEAARLAITSRKPKCGASWLAKSVLRAVMSTNVGVDDASCIAIELGGEFEPEAPAKPTLSSTWRRRPSSASSGSQRSISGGWSNRRGSTKELETATPNQSSSESEDGSTHNPKRFSTEHVLPVPKLEKQPTPKVGFSFFGRRRAAVA